jgi:hypothetical protein
MTVRMKLTLILMTFPSWLGFLNPAPEGSTDPHGHEHRTDGLVRGGELHCRA